MEKFWRDCEDADRQWVPWAWCSTKFVQSKNNSIVLFSPSNDTMHGVKVNYDHLVTQRTQLYGNFWFKNSNTKYSPSWEQLEARDFAYHPSVPERSRMAGAMQSVKSKLRFVKKLTPKDKNIGDRNN